jgi:hypothetical protein
MLRRLSWLAEALPAPTLPVEVGLTPEPREPAKTGQDLQSVGQSTRLHAQHVLGGDDGDGRWAGVAVLDDPRAR